jgi:SHS2 domain-containing protein
MAERQLIAGSAEDLLVAVVNEVFYWLHAEGEIPVSVAVRPAGDDGVDLVLSLSGVGAVEITGAALKAASLHDLRCAPDPAGQWCCSVTVDV